MSVDRSPDEILADPMASPEELTSLVSRYLEQVIAHPNCPPEFWWEHLPKAPLFVMSTPLFPLLTLESPERWTEMERQMANSWFNDNRHKLTATSQRLFAADCADHVLPYYENQPAVEPESAPREAIALARKMACGMVSEAERSAMAHRMNEILVDRRFHDANRALAACASVIDRNPKSALDLASYCAMDAVASHYNETFSWGVTGRSHVIAYMIWQWHRLCYYLGKKS